VGSSPNTHPLRYDLRAVILGIPHSKGATKYKPKVTMQSSLHDEEPPTPQERPKFFMKKHNAE
jgi:hypothetical protein